MLVLDVSFQCYFSSETPNVLLKRNFHMHCLNETLKRNSQT